MNNELYTIFTVCGWISLFIMIVAQNKEMNEWVENVAFAIAITCFVIALLINIIPGNSL